MILKHLAPKTSASEGGIGPWEQLPKQHLDVEGPSVQSRKAFWSFIWGA